MKYFSLERLKSEIFRAETPPKVTAVSFALGVGLAFSPIPGLHILTAFFISRLFRVNSVLLLVGVLVHNPWTMIPIHLTGLLIGDLLLYHHPQSIAQFNLFPWHELGLSTMFDSSFWQMNGQILQAFIKPFVMGHSLMCTIMFFLTYRLTLLMLSKQGVSV